MLYKIYIQSSVLFSRIYLGTIPSGIFTATIENINIQANPFLSGKFFLYYVYIWVCLIIFYSYFVGSIPSNLAGIHTELTALYISDNALTGM